MGDQDDLNLFRHLSHEWGWESTSQLNLIMNEIHAGMIKQLATHLRTSVL